MKAFKYILVCCVLIQVSLHSQSILQYQRTTFTGSYQSISGSTGPYGDDWAENYYYTLDYSTEAVDNKIFPIHWRLVMKNNFTVIFTLVLIFILSFHLFAQIDEPKVNEFANQRITHYQTAKWPSQSFYQLLLYRSSKK